MELCEIFRGVEIVWFLWLTSWLLLGVTLRSLRLHLVRFDFRLLWRRLRIISFHQDQRGAAYSLAFILVFPFIVFLVALIIETSFMLVAKLGTMHAAFAAARTATVWSTADTKTKLNEKGLTNLAQSKAEKAAVIAMVPYAAGTGNFSEKDKDAENYWKIYDEFRTISPTPKKSKYSELSDRYIQNKYRYTARNTRVELSLVSPKKTGSASNLKPYEKMVQAEVTYVYPFHIFPVGKQLGAKEADGKPVYKIHSTAWINNECPQNDSGKIDIKIYP